MLVLPVPPVRWTTASFTQDDLAAQLAHPAAQAVASLDEAVQRLEALVAPGDGALDGRS